MPARFRDCAFAEVDLILSLSKDEVVANSPFPTSWFDRLTMRSKEIISEPI
jgi:hypothetical protein